MSKEVSHAYCPDRSLLSKIRRRLTQRRSVLPLPKTPQPGIVSFTFDDFPKSAAQHGAEVLDTIGAKGTFYAASNLLGVDSIMGPLFNQFDIESLLECGHEIGLHTHRHIDCAKATPGAVRHEVLENKKALNALCEDRNVAHFAWPYGETSFAAKKAISNIVRTGRGILPGINQRGSDSMQLWSYELGARLGSTNSAERAIETAAKNGGWVTIFTHDVHHRPSPFGVTPETLRLLVRLANWR